MKAAQYKIVKDVEMSAKLFQLKQNPNMVPEALKEISAIEVSKISDGLESEFGFDLAHLNKAVTHYSLDNN